MSFPVLFALHSLYPQRIYDNHADIFHEIDMELQSDHIRQFHSICLQELFFINQMLNHFPPIKDHQKSSN